MSSSVLQLERPSRQAAIERLAFEQLHREIELALVLVEAVDRADVRMIERRRGARLAPEPLDRLLARRRCPSGSTFSATCRPSLMSCAR